MALELVSFIPPVVGLSWLQHQTHDLAQSICAPESQPAGATSPSGLSRIGGRRRLYIYIHVFIYRNTYIYTHTYIERDKEVYQWATLHVIITPKPIAEALRGNLDLSGYQLSPASFPGTLYFCQNISSFSF